MHNNFVTLENDYTLVRGILFDKLDLIDDNIALLQKDVIEIKERLDTDEVYIRVFNNKLRL
jgi:hypothetical protein